MVVRKRRRGMLGKPYNSDKRLNNLTYTILGDSDNQNLNTSIDQIKDLLEAKHSSGELSNEAYEQINEEILAFEKPDN
jgi:hypothetical protein